MCHLGTPQGFGGRERERRGDRGKERYSKGERVVGEEREAAQGREGVRGRQGEEEKERAKEREEEMEVERRGGEKQRRRRRGEKSGREEEREKGCLPFVQICEELRRARSYCSRKASMRQCKGENEHKF